MDWQKKQMNKLNKDKQMMGGQINDTWRYKAGDGWIDRAGS